MRGNSLVRIEKPEYGKLLIKKSRGRLTFDDIYDALDAEGIEEGFVLFIKGPKFSGWNDADDISEVLLHNLSTADTCPACAKALEDMRGEFYEAAYEDGYRVGNNAAFNNNG